MLAYLVFHVLLEGLPLRIVPVALVIDKHILADVADRNVVAAVLVPEDVAAPLGSLGEVINKFLLLERERLESRYFIAEHLDVRKAVHAPG